MMRLLWIVLVAMASGCSNDSLEAKAPGAWSKDAGAYRQCYGANDCPPGTYCNELGACVPLSATTEAGVSPDAGLPPEVESKSEPPATGKSYLYVAVPQQDMVAKIDSLSLKVSALKVGSSPGALRTVPGQDVAVVLNRLSSTASILRSRADGSDEILTLKTAAGLNQLALAPDGKHAVAFFDVLAAGPSPGAKQSYQEVTLLRLSPGQEAAINLTVGFRPSEVQFDAGSQLAFVVTEQGISTIALAATTKPTIVPTIPLLKDPLKEPTVAEVVITPDGKLALLRQAGVKGIRAVELATKKLIDLPLASDATDLDLTPDGKLALVVLREGAQIVLVDLPSDLADPTGIDTLSTSGYTVGQAELTDDGQHAFLFSNATTQEVVLVADLAARTLGVFPLKKGVRAVRPAPGGATAVILHNKVPGAASPADGVEGLLDRSWGYSLLSLPQSFARLQITEADPGQLAFSSDGKAAFMLLSNPAAAIRALDAIDLSTFLCETVSVGSPPVSVGIVPATGRVFVAQDHPLGRITFVDAATLATKTVTGFELNSYVIE
jgi:DNA-binding beta-propeller fold protein YncE